MNLVSVVLDPGFPEQMPVWFIPRAPCALGYASARPSRMVYLAGWLFSVCAGVYASVWGPGIGYIRSLDNHSLKWGGGNLNGDKGSWEVMHLLLLIYDPEV